MVLDKSSVRLLSVSDLRTILLNLLNVVSKMLYSMFYKYVDKREKLVGMEGIEPPIRRPKRRVIIRFTTHP